MDNSPSYSLKSSVIMADFRNVVNLRFKVCVIKALHG